MNINSVVKTSTNHEFMRNKNVLVGTSRMVDGDIYLATTGMTIELTKVNYVPSLFKIYDEIIVNAVDHFINCILKDTIQHKCGDKSERYVSMIVIKLSENGNFSVINDGYGIPIVVHDRYNKYLPEVLFTEERTGTNMDNDASRITGGTNGIGATTISAFSNFIKLTICDKNKKYIQEANMVGTELKFGAPSIADNVKGFQYTSVSFTVNWKKTAYKTFSIKTKGLISNYVIKRLMQTSLYARHVINTANSMNIIPATLACPAISFNDMNIATDFSEESMNATFNMIKSFTIELVAKKPAANLLASKLTLVIGVNNVNKPGYKEISIINGVEVLHNPIAEAIKTSIVKSVKIHCEQNKMSTGNIKAKNYITIIIVGCIPDPQWVGQVKEGLTLTREFISNYDIREKCDSVKQNIAKIVYEMITNDRLKKTRVRSKDVLKSNELYSRCLSVSLEGKRTNSKVRTRLFICEGASAASLISNVLDKGHKLNNTNTGTLCSKGVIINTYHKMNWYSNSNFEFIKLGIDEERKCKLIYNEQIEESKFIQTFITCTNLSENDISDDDMLRRLNYDEIICATDSDYDGWNITGLLIVLLSKWGVLLKEGRVKILHLPVIRVIPSDLDEQTTKMRNKNKGSLPVEFINSIKYWEFNSQREYKEWIKTNSIPNTHIVKYYKGLASTDDFFDFIIARDIDKYIYTFVWDKHAARSLEIFYGKTRVVEHDGEVSVVKMSDERKKLLSTPVREMNDKELELYSKRYIAITTFLYVFVKQYFVDNLGRKLLKIMDGKNNVSSKIVYALPNVFKRNAFQKVSEVGPRIGTLTRYHHGETSLNKSVQNSGQQFPGSVMFPVIIPSGKWGTRHDGGEIGSHSSAGQARYVSCKLNDKFYNKLYREEDRIVLDYQEDEGYETEPKFMLPVVPTIAMENYNTVAHGWKIQLYARSAIEISHYLQYMLRAELETNQERKEAYLSRLAKSFSIEHRNYDIKPIAFCNENHETEFFLSKGGYRTDEDDENKIIIHSLPIGVWTTNYVQSIENKIGTKESQGSLWNIVKSIESFSKETVNICVTMHNGWQDKIISVIDEDAWYGDNMDPVEKLLHLYTKITDEINVIDENGKVKTFKYYTDLVKYWFNVRVTYYKKRVDRMKEFTKLKILREEEKKRYLSNFHKMELSGKNDVSFDEKLDSEGFKKFRNFTNKLKFNIVPTDKIIMFATSNDEFDDEFMFNDLVDSGIIDRNASYGYLKRLTTGQTSQSGIEKYNKKIAEYQQKLNWLSKDKIEYEIFLKEVQELTACMVKEFP